MTPLVQLVTTVVSVGTLLVQIYIVVLIAGLLAGKRTWPLVRLTEEYALILGLVVTGAGFLFSVFYSQIAGFLPCTMCWWQRIFLYPQIVIFAVALYYKKTQGVSAMWAVTTSIILSVIGGLLALYQYYAQMFNPGLLSACAVTGVSCTKLFFVSFGYMTLPFMSLVSFIVLIVIMMIYRKTL